MGNSGGKSRDGVKMRSKKKGRKDRPLSDGDLQPPVTTQETNLRRAGSETIGGTRMEEVVRSPHPPQQGPSKKPTQGAAILADHATLQLYRKRLDAVLDAWPELTSLRDVDVKLLTSSAMEALSSLYQEASQECAESTALREERRQLRDYVSGLEQRCNRQEDEIRRKSGELEAMADERGVLVGELRRRGIEPRLLARQDIPEEPRSDYEDPAPSAEMRGADDGIGAAGPENSGGRGFRPRSMYIPTPLARMTASDLSTGIRRTQSLRSGQSSDDGAPGGGRGRGLVGEGGDPGRKMRNVQSQLEEERRENEKLRRRLADLGHTSSLTLLTPAGGPTIDSLRRRYDELEERALSAVGSILASVLPRVGDADRHQFLCYTMLLASDQASDLYEYFKVAFRYLLVSPLKPEIPENEFPNISGRRGSANTNRFLFNQGKQLLQGSRLAKRTRASSELPRYLEEEVLEYLRLTSDNVSIDDLAESVSANLQAKFPSCSAVVSNATYWEFLRECCRLAWQLNTTSQASYITLGDNRRYDERCHSILPSQSKMAAAIGAEIDYFAWPILYRSKNGEVLYKGRVAISMRL